MLPSFHAAFTHSPKCPSGQIGTPCQSPINRPPDEETEAIRTVIDVSSYSAKITTCLQSHGFTTQTSQYLVYEDGSIKRAVTRMEDENPERPKLIRDREKMMTNVRLFKKIFPNVSPMPDGAASSSTPPSR